MKLQTQAFVGILVIAIGAATLILASQGADDHVRLLEDLEKDPAAHQAGSFTLLGVAEPARVPLTGPNGTRMADNPQAPTQLTWTRGWREGGETRFSRVSLALSQSEGRLSYAWSNETRRLPTDAPLSVTYGNGSLAFTGVLTAVRGFDDGDGHTPMLWALLEKAPSEPLQPKPGQFTGHLLGQLPDGSPLPPGALVYQVSTYTAGCSSKFLPPEELARQNATV